MPKTKKPTSKDTATESSPVADFERNLDTLEQLVDAMERGEMTLEESLAAYERGIGLYRHCQKALEEAQLRVRLVSDPEHADTSMPFPALSTDTSDA